MVCIQDAIIASAIIMVLGIGNPSPLDFYSCDTGKSSVDASLDDVFEAESAIAGESLAFAPATQVLSVGPFGVNVALCYCTGTACFVASLEERLEFSSDTWHFNLQNREKAYMTCDVLNTVWVELLLAFPTVLFEVNLEHTML